MRIACDDEWNWEKSPPHSTIPKYPNWGMLIDEVAIVTCEPPSLKRLLQYELTTNDPHQTDLSTGPIFQSSMWKAIIWCVKRASLTKNKRMMMESNLGRHMLLVVVLPKRKVTLESPRTSVRVRSSKWVHI